MVKILYKTSYKAGGNHNYNIYKTNHPVTLIDVKNVFDLNILATEKDFPNQKSSLFLHSKVKEISYCLWEKKSTTEFILEKECRYNLHFVE